MTYIYSHSNMAFHRMQEQIFTET